MALYVGNTKIVRQKTASGGYQLAPETSSSQSVSNKRGSLIATRIIQEQQKTTAPPPPPPPEPEPQKPSITASEGFAALYTRRQPEFARVYAEQAEAAGARGMSVPYSTQYGTGRDYAGYVITPDYTTQTSYEAPPTRKEKVLMTLQAGREKIGIDAQRTEQERLRNIRQARGTVFAQGAPLQPRQALADDIRRAGIVKSDLARPITQFVTEIPAYVVEKPERALTQIAGGYAGGTILGIGTAAGLRTTTGVRAATRLAPLTPLAAQTITNIGTGAIITQPQEAARITLPLAAGIAGFRSGYQYATPQLKGYNFGQQPIKEYITPELPSSSFGTQRGSATIQQYGTTRNVPAARMIYSQSTPKGTGTIYQEAFTKIPADILPARMVASTSKTAFTYNTITGSSYTQPRGRAQEFTRVISSTRRGSTDLTQIPGVANIRYNELLLTGTMSRQTPIRLSVAEYPDITTRTSTYGRTKNLPILREQIRLTTQEFYPTRSNRKGSLAISRPTSNPFGMPQAINRPMTNPATIPSSMMMPRGRLYVPTPELTNMRTIKGIRSRALINIGGAMTAQNALQSMTMMGGMGRIGARTNIFTEANLGRTGAMPNTMLGVEPTSKSIYTPTPDFATLTITDTPTRTMQEQGFTNTPRPPPPGFIETPYTPPPPAPPFPIPFGMPTWGMGGTGTKTKKGKQRGFSYKPDLRALLGGITSKKAPKIITGLESRPIIRL